MTGHLRVLNPTTREIQPMSRHRLQHRGAVKERQAEFVCVLSGLLAQHRCQSQSTHINTEQTEPRTQATALVHAHVTRLNAASSLTAKTMLFGEWAGDDLFE